MLVVVSRKNDAQPYCECWNDRVSSMEALRSQNSCNCGEEVELTEWRWCEPDANMSSAVKLHNEGRQVLFHPHYSSGTATVKGDSPLRLNYIHYFEIKILTDTYGTDIMVGVGTNKVDIGSYKFKFASLLGGDSESYGLSYRGMVRHSAGVRHDTRGFCRGSIIGVRVDLWHGTLQYYINREPQGISFYNLRRHTDNLYPMLCSTAAQSSMRLTYASSCRASLLVDAAKILATAAWGAECNMPPGLRHFLWNNFWMTLPSKNVECEELERERRSTLRVDMAARCHSPPSAEVIYQVALDLSPWPVEPVLN